MQKSTYSIGGGMRQVGVLAAAGLYALRHNIDRLELDHQHAKQVAKGYKHILFQIMLFLKKESLRSDC